MGLADRMRRAAASPFDWLSSQLRPPAESELLWAVRDASFEIPKGEAIGLIGRNGSGKSTLLKLLARITEPTEGRADIYGHVASLLEVGTGMHPELTGRENIYLNGCILGMNTASITRNFEIIVEFSGIEKFLDTQVKRYSSGMRVRLGFAIAAHLQPEILLIDEVLAVGDAEFQRRCLGKMKDVTGSGRTIVFVSHNMGAIRSLTSRCIYMESGSIIGFDRSDAIVDRYMHDSIQTTSADGQIESLAYYRRKQAPDATVSFRSIQVGDTAGVMPRIPFGSAIPITYQLDAIEALRDIVLTLSIKTESGDVVTFNTSRDGGHHLELTSGTNRLTSTVQNLHLMPGRYFLTCSVAPQLGQRGWDLIRDYPGFEIVNVGENALQISPERPGVIHWPHCEWLSSN